MRPVSPLGKYAAVVAATAVLGIIGAAILSHVIGTADAFLDGLALAAFGLIAGTAGSLTTLNGTVARTAAQDDELAALRAEVAALKSTRKDAP